MLENYNDSLVSPFRNFPLEFLFLRDDDIPEYVQDGIADLGIVGENVIEETGADVTYLQRLGFGRCSLKIAVPNHSDVNSVRDLEGKAIATSYPNILKKFLDQQGVNATVRLISGSVEISTNLGLRDAICDNVSTGGSLTSNGLKPFYHVLHSKTVILT